MHTMLVFALCGTAAADVTWRNLSVQRPDRQFLLRPTSGVARAGSVTAVLGASGAGKSTFLRALVNAAFVAVSSFFSRASTPSKVDAVIVARRCRNSASSFAATGFGARDRSASASCLASAARFAAATAMPEYLAVDMRAVEASRWRRARARGVRARARVGGEDARRGVWIAAVRSRRARLRGGAAKR